ncbi:MAG TPA: class I SAM-dependent methyltransferase [Frankiaceae bacterium]|nr:class I SAM-dependent methyltransferase [Frankiaceae bacterium]
MSRLGPEYAIPAACRGSAHPAWLRWIADRLRLSPIDRFLDAGAGLGGPSAWLSRTYLPGLVPVLAEPMIGACQAARTMFSLETVSAWSQSLPFPDGTFDAAWCLGVLCTTAEKSGLLNELRRVLTRQGRLGLLVLVQAAAELTDAPEGNDFPTDASLLTGLAAAGFTVSDRIEAGKIDTADDQWQRKVSRIDEVLAERYGDRPDWRLAQEQERRIARLLERGDLQTWLITARVST